jgi:hypothetical protein
MAKIDLSHLTIEEKEQLKGYLTSIKEIKKEVHKMLNKPKTESDETRNDKSVGGNRSTGQYYQI